MNTFAPVFFSLKTRLRRRHWAGFILTCFVASTGFSNGEIPLREIARSPLVSSVTISPDGKHVALVRTDDHDRGSLLLLNLDSGKLDGVAATQNVDIYSTRWSRNGHVLYQLSLNKLYAYGLFVAQPGELSRQRPLNRVDLLRFIGRPRHRPERILAWIYKPGLSDAPTGGLVELDVTSTIRGMDISEQSRSIVRRYSTPPGVVIGYMADFDGEPGLAYTFEQGLHLTYLWEPESNEWRPIPLNRDILTPLAFDPDRRQLWVVMHTERHGYQVRPFGLDIFMPGEVIHTDADYNPGAGRLLFSALTRKPVGLIYEGSRVRNVWFSQKFGEHQNRVNELLPAAQDHVITDWDDAERRFLVRSSSPMLPDEYAVFIPEEDRLIPVGGTAPGVPVSSLRPARAVSWTARDGLKLEGYLTLPAGATKENRAPLVVLVHGGPWSRDNWSYDPEAQFLASRGYAVLQPNYRGSSGYSPEVSATPRYAFDKMRDDVVDATRALLASGLVDPRRVAVMGASFGGYLALACATEEPDLYRAAISNVGVFDWAEQTHAARDTRRSRPGEYAVLLNDLGDPKRDRQRYDEISIFNRLDRLRAPVFLAHGIKDNIVSVRQTRRLAGELKRRGHEHETFYRVISGHGFARLNDRVSYYQAIERFLARHIPPEGEPRH